MLTTLREVWGAIPIKPESDTNGWFGTFRKGGELPLWTGTSDVPISERISLPDPQQTIFCRRHGA
jgi:hypothetical protein